MSILFFFSFRYQFFNCFILSYLETCFKVCERILCHELTPTFTIYRWHQILCYRPRYEYFHLLFESSLIFFVELMTFLLDSFSSFLGFFLFFFFFWFIMFRFFACHLFCNNHYFVPCVKRKQNYCLFCLFVKYSLSLSPPLSLSLTQTQTQTHTHTHIHTHVHSHSRTHTHTHIYTLSYSLSHSHTHTHMRT